MRRLIPLLWICMLFVSCECYHKPDPSQQKLKRTVLVYIAAENGLAYGNFPEQDQKEMESAIDDVPSDCRLVVFVDDTDLPRIYSWEADKSGRKVKTPIYTYADEVNSASASTLRDVVRMVVEKYPSESYGLVLWSHGRAWLPAAAAPDRHRGASSEVSDSALLLDVNADPLRRSFGVDNGSNSYSNSGSRMEIADLATALEEFPRFDFIFFDACFMQSVEVAWDLRKATRWLIGSPAEIPGPGAPYEKVLAPMFYTDDYARGIVEAYYKGYADECVPLTASSDDCFGVVLSAVDCDRLETLRKATSDVILAYMSSSIDDNVSRVQHYFPYASTEIPYYFDMLDYMRNNIASSEVLQEWERTFYDAIPIRAATDTWYSAYSNGLCDVNQKNYGGISCYVPLNGKVFAQLNEWFRRTSWYTAASWNQVGW